MVSLCYKYVAPYVCVFRSINARTGCRPQLGKTALAQLIITECSSGAIFASHNTIKECYFLADLFIEKYGYKEIEKIVLKTKAMQFDTIMNDFINYPK